MTGKNLHIVFLGNCQAAAMRNVIDRFVAPYEAITTDFVDAFQENDATALDRLRPADVVVGQASSQPQPLGHEHVRQGVPIHLFPSVSGAFLYPYRGVPHPANPLQRDGVTPYPPDYCDRYLAKLYVEKVAPDEALARYKEHDVAAAARLGRVYELTLEGQRHLDRLTGYACAELIETYLQDERLFQSAFHFGGRIARHLGGTLCDRLGFDAKYGERVRTFLHEGPFVVVHVPVHPSVARFFDLRWAKDELHYPYRWEGAFTFDEYVVRFMRVQWSRALQEGVEDARKGLAGAKQKLEVGLREAPRSAEGAHEMSRILEREQDAEGALAMQERAAAASPDAYMSIRLGELLRKAGDTSGCERAFRQALDLDPVSPRGWALWRDALRALGRNPEAQSAARRARLYEVGGGAEAGTAAPSVGSGAQTASTEVLDLQAHVQNVGDVRSDVDGWVGRKGSGRAIEGFAISKDTDLPLHGVSYQAVLRDGSLSEPVKAGRYCGTRGKNVPIYGVLLSLDGELSPSLELRVDACFVGSATVQTFSGGVVCKAEAFMTPLECLRLTVRAAG